MLKIEKINKKCPVYDISVSDNNNFFGNGILVHNCTEILEPSRASTLIDEELLVRESGERQVRKKYKAGEIALCNLSSVNLLQYYYLTDEAKNKFIINLVTFMDNTIDIARYPVKEGMNSNQLYRYLGIGVSNFTNLLATEKIVIDTQEALEFTHKLFDDLSYRIIYASHELAMKRGSFAKFDETNWAKGILPIHMANKKAKKLTKYQPDMNRWRDLAKKIQKHGIRNALLMAIAPTACQTIDGKIKTFNGIQSLKSICIENNIDFKKIHNENLIGWYNFKQPIMVETRFGIKESRRIWYNGKQKTRTIIFDDNKEYTFTLNHELLTKTNNSYIWTKVGELKENDDIIQLKPIMGYDGIYSISSDGEVYSHRSNKMLQPEISNTGYKRVDLRINGKHDKRSIHRLVGEAFIENTNTDKIFINHKNGKKTDNNYNNIEWATPSENNIHASKYGKMKRNLTMNESNLIKKERKKFGTTYRELAENYGSNISTIFRICKGESYVN